MALIGNMGWKTVVTMNIQPSDFTEPWLETVRNKLSVMVDEGKTDGIDERDEVDQYFQITRYWVDEAAANEWISCITENFPEGRFIITNVFELPY